MTTPERFTQALDAAELESVTRDRLLWRRADRDAKRIVDAEDRPPAEFPEVLTLAERLARPIDPVAWCVEGWLPAGGRAVMAAQAKTGKTTAVANLVRCLVDRQPWLGRDVVTPVRGKVAVIDFEMSERQLDAWYRTIGIEAADKVLLLPMRGRAGAFDLRDDKQRDQWAELLTDHGVEFVVWDCLRPTLDALGMDEHREAGVLLTAFDALLEAAGKPAALVVHHMGHSEERSRGDSRIRDWPDVEWKLVREGAARFISAYGRDVDQPETQYALDLTTKRITMQGGSRAEVKISAAANAVRDVLAENPEPLTKSAIEGSVVGVSRDAARKALVQLVTTGQVVVETGQHNALLHRLAESSSPVRGSSRQFAGEQPVSSPPLYSGELASGMASQEDTHSSAPRTSGLTAEQQVLLDQIGGDAA